MKSLLTSILTTIFLLTGPGANTGVRAGQENLLQGDCKIVFDGKICTWARMAGDELVEFGASIPLSTAENAPLEGEMVMPPITLARIAVPEEVTARTGIDHLGVNWEVHGHPPGPYLTPHFDFHFYMVSGTEIDAIDCSDTSKPDIVPAAYVLPDIEIPELGALIGLCVPQMGMHAMLEEEVNSADLFGASMIIGYYARELIFIEPMIARKKLLDRAGFKLDIPAVKQHGQSHSWPGSFEAVYDEETQEYQFIFTMADRP